MNLFFIFSSNEKCFDYKNSFANFYAFSLQHNFACVKFETLLKFLTGEKNTNRTQTSRTNFIVSA